MDFKLELVIIPVSDVDRAKAFYTEKLGFKLEVDGSANEGARICAGDSARLGMLDRLRERAEPGREPARDSCAGLAARTAPGRRGHRCSPQ